VQKLRAAAASLGVAWPDGASVGAVVATIDPGTPRGAAFLDQAAELLRGAGYTAFDGTPPAETGHGGVGAPYAHVTAPLRRLADRYATEACLALYAGRPVPEWVREALQKLPKVMADTDRVASAANRAAVEMTEAVLLHDRVGEEFDAGVVDVDAPQQNGGQGGGSGGGNGGGNGGGKRSRKPGGTVALDDPPVRARCEGDLPLGERIRVRLTVADPTSRTVLFERA
jgi:exoribonuclease R